jgi:phage baseplate assembly protein W
MMPVSHEQFGIDLRLLRDLERQNDRFLERRTPDVEHQNDRLLEQRRTPNATVRPPSLLNINAPRRLGSVPTRDLLTVLRSESQSEDLETVEAVDNLRQALLLRFLTRMGELTDLGHPDYGSRLYQLIGELNNEANRNRAKLYVLESLHAEPRVQEVLAVTVTQSRVDRTRMDISVSVRTIVASTVLNLVFPFFLEGGARP